MITYTLVRTSAIFIYAFIHSKSTLLTIIISSVCPLVVIVHCSVNQSAVQTSRFAESSWISVPEMRETPGSLCCWTHSDQLFSGTQESVSHLRVGLQAQFPVCAPWNGSQAAGRSAPVTDTRRSGRYCSHHHRGLRSLLISVCVFFVFAFPPLSRWEIKVSELWWLTAEDRML